jgi:septum formation topological specificity factor MinE
LAALDLTLSAPESAQLKELTEVITKHFKMEESVQISGCSYSKAQEIAAVCASN